MATVASSKPTIGNVVKYEDLPEYGLCRKAATVLAETGMTIGSVVKSDGDGTYSWVTNASVATLPADVGVLVDANIYDGTLGDRTLAIINIPTSGANAVIARNALNYKDTVSGGNQTTVQTALNARGILLVTQV